MFRAAMRSGCPGRGGRVVACVQPLENRVLLHAGHDLGGETPSSPAAPSALSIPAVPLAARVITAGATGATGPDLLPDLVPLANQADDFVYGWVIDSTERPGRDLLRLTSAVVNRGRGPL